MLSKPSSDRFPSYFARYIDKCPDDILPFLSSQESSFKTFLESIPEEKWDYAYAPGKWTLKQSIVHLIETEKIFAYRSLAISRKESGNLPGFDQDLYVSNFDSSHLDHHYVIKDFVLTRALTNHLFQGYSQDQWGHMGRVSGNPIINKALPYMIGGHTQHHIEIIKERYL